MYANEANRNQSKRYREQKTTKQFQLNDKQNQLMMNKMVKYYILCWLNTRIQIKKTCAWLRSFHSLWLCLHSIIIIWNLQSIFMVTVWRHVDHLSFQFLFLLFSSISQLVKFFESLHSNYSDFSYQAEHIQTICDLFTKYLIPTICNMYQGNWLFKFKLSDRRSKEDFIHDNFFP